MPEAAICPACTQAACQPVSWPMWLFDSRLLREALAQLNLPAVPAIIRAATGLSQLDLATIAGWNRSTLGYYEHGQRDGIFDIRVFLAFADAVDMPREVLLPLLLGGVGAVVVPDVDVDEADVELNRRDFGGLAAGTAATALLPEFKVPSSVGISHVRYLQRCEDALWSREQTVGGAALLQAGLRQWRRARRMLKESRYSEVVGRELLLATGSLGVCVGWLAFDGGQHKVARRLHAEAESLAEAAADPVLTADALQQASMLASYTAWVTGRDAPAREGLQLAYHAAEEARYEQTPRLQALIALRHAKAASLLGDKAAFCSGISRARRAIERRDQFEEPEQFSFVGDAEIASCEANGYVNLGDPQRGEELHRTALAGDMNPRNRLSGQAWLAESLLRQGAVNQAIDEAASILPALSDGVTSIRVVSTLHPIRITAEHAKAEEFCLRFDELERKLAVRYPAADLNTELQ